MKNSLDISSGYRKFCTSWWKHYFSWYPYRNAVVFSYQRITRGWADCDVWGMDDTLAHIIPEMIGYLKENKHGIPSTMFPEDYPYYSEQSSKAKYEAARAFAELKWENVLNDIIAGFKAYNEISSNNFPKQFKKELETSTGWYKDLGLKDIEYDWEAIHDWEKKQEKVFKKGMNLLTKHFRSMWD